MKTQLHLFLTAVMFYTRIPCPPWVGHEPDYLNRATIYFPLIGWIVGGICAGVFAGAQWLFPTNLALLLSIIAGIWTTGAFHEDGFADVCDGFGGGWTQAKILEIMKDSRLGTYGAAGLGLLLATKFLALQAFDYETLIAMMLVAHPLSRFVALTFIYTHAYVRENEDSKAKPVAKKISAQHLAGAAVGGLLPLVVYCFWQNDFKFLLILLPLMALKWYLARFFVKWIGGYTGDCLGATQQLAEVVIYLSAYLVI